MAVYTKTGDTGETGLYGGTRVSKADVQVEAYGNVDELSAWLGLVCCEALGEEDQKWVTAVQKNLYVCMSALCGADVDLGNVDKHILETEKHIDRIDAALPPLRNFIIPQGTRASVVIHIARTVCRRAERTVVRAHGNAVVIQYLNRLSDALFVLARKYNDIESEAILT